MDKDEKNCSDIKNYKNNMRCGNALSAISTILLYNITRDYIAKAA
ncbi:MAG: hypothetical protein ACK5AV_01595 [Alphaproteobacteria bacterium]|jgi:hypothetical protein